MRCKSFQRPWSGPENNIYWLDATAHGKRTTAVVAIRGKCYVTLCWIRIMQIHVWGLRAQRVSLCRKGSVKHSGRAHAPTKEGKKYTSSSDHCPHTLPYTIHTSFTSLRWSSLNKHYFSVAEVDHSYTKSKTVNVNAQYLLRENLSVVFCQWCNCVQTLQER